ncbi:ammonium transporter [Candidatus Methanoperedens nitroreducens]|uniref:Ammonium transporter n=1 Tax=Candidatus Methanoperedens nitratireducens TaxID=1392998 RepID=A0A062UZI8_9EURY|nr:ammonium transporter [Candidatus Methanoperedens nitroreducens]KCZ72341.1 ammonium transporter [Candidatus Methanoperedens nitroreducens]
MVGMEGENMDIKRTIRYLKYIFFAAILLSTLADGVYAAEVPEIDKADTAWVLISTALVMIMIPGVGLFYGGMVRKKNALSTMILSFAILALISVQWVLFGYSLVFGPDVGGVIGNLQWVGLNGVGQEPNADYAATVPALAFMIFQAMFAIIAVALITGAFVERIKFSAFLIFSVLWATLVYDPIAHWIWGTGGWLREMGTLDFAGGAVVHISAGMSALAVALVIGARRGFGKYTMEPHSIPITILGAALLWFGWFGFNAGSAVTSNGLAASAFVVTNIAGGTAALVWILLSWYYKKPSGLGIATGAVVGLAAVTPASGFVTPLAAMVIGAVAAVVSYYAMLFRMRRNIDESLDVWACHGIGGAWGIIAAGIFATTLVNPAGSGLIDGNADQIVTQIVAVGVTSVYAFVVTLIIAKIIDVTIGLRVRDDEEAIGLDLSQHAEKAYS